MASVLEDHIILDASLARRAGSLGRKAPSMLGGEELDQLSFGGLSREDVAEQNGGLASIEDSLPGDMNFIAAQLIQRVFLSHLWDNCAIGGSHFRRTSHRDSTD